MSNPPAADALPARHATSLPSVDGMRSPGADTGAANGARLCPDHDIELEVSPSAWRTLWRWATAGSARTAAAAVATTVTRMIRETPRRIGCASAMTPPFVRMVLGP